MAGLLYVAAFRIEWTVRAELWIRGVAFEAQRIAVARHEEPPFPIERVLVALALAAFVAALARRVDGTGSETSKSRGLTEILPRRHVRAIAVAAVACFVTITLLGRT